MTGQSPSTGIASSIHTGLALVAAAVMRAGAVVAVVMEGEPLAETADVEIVVRKKWHRVTGDAHA